METPIRRSDQWRRDFRLLSVNLVMFQEFQNGAGTFGKCDINHPRPVCYEKADLAAPLRPFSSLVFSKKRALLSKP